MKIHKKTTIFFVCSLIAFTTVQGQNHIKYNYDEGGNRISRKVVVLATQRAQARQSAQLTDSVSDLLDDISVTIYPNPVQENLIIATKGLSHKDFADFVLYNVKGDLIYQKKSAEDVSTIPMSSYSKGVYILITIIKNKRKEFKIIKQ